MKNSHKFYINGEWVEPTNLKTLEVINPADESSLSTIALGDAKDVEKAVSAARNAFESFSNTSRDDRISLLEAIEVAYKPRFDEMAETISKEMGAPMWLCKGGQAKMMSLHLKTTIKVLKSFEFNDTRGKAHLRKEPIGVCGFITPWNWPINQISTKVFPAIATGCTMVLKPTEVAPLNAILFAEVLHEAGVPKGVFNLINGDGPSVGEALSSHPDIDMMSFTGSTRAGIRVAKAAADTVKRVTQELGGKSPNIILEDADLERSITNGVNAMTMNSGQSCNAPSRMFVPADLQDKVVEIARAVAEGTTVGDPNTKINMGPVVSKAQFDKIQGLIGKGIEEGATLVCGGLGRPDGIDKGYYVKPTIFSNVKNDMTIAREEIFGPVLCILPYESEEEAIKMANDTLYGLSGYVSGTNPTKLKEIANKIRAGNVHINGADMDFNAPFGGYKQSGNGREWGSVGFEEFLEIKAVMDIDAA